MNLENIDFVAIYGAIVATLVLVWDFVKYFSDRRKIIIKCNRQKSELLDRLTIGGCDPDLSITITNQSNRNCDIESISFVIIDKNKEYNPPEAEGLPIRLDSGGSFNFSLYKYKEGVFYQEALNCKQIEVQISDGQIWKSKKYPFFEGIFFRRWWAFRKFLKTQK